MEKIDLIKYKKLSEFNFKITMHCKSVSLEKNVIQKMCNICNREESNEHLFYQCNYAQFIWNDFSRIIGITSTLKCIVTDDILDKTYNFNVTLIAFLIYKKCLRESMNNIQDI